MVSYEELASSEFGREMLKAQDKVGALKMVKVQNEIGLDKVVAWNPYKLKEKNPFSVVISNSFDQMLKNVIPENAVLSTRFENWIQTEKNELMVDSKINKDAYFKEQTNFQTGEISENKGANLIKAKIDYLNKQLSTIAKAFQTFMKDKPEDAYASLEELNLWKNYYQNQMQKINEKIEKKDYSSYNITNNKKEVVKEGNKEKALEHKHNTENLLNKVDKAIEEQKQRRNSSEQKQDQEEFVNEKNLPNLKNVNKK